MNQLVRLANHEDQPVIEAIVEAAYAPYIQRIGRKPSPMLDDYAALIRDQRVHVLAKGRIVDGILVLIPKDGFMLLDNIAVHPAAQRLGHGRKLLDHAERIALDAGDDLIRLYTNEAMVENIALYRRLGFVETHRGEEKGLRRVYMEKLLYGAY